MKYLFLVLFFLSAYDAVAATATQNSPTMPGRTATATSTVTAVYNSGTDSVVFTYNLTASSPNQIANASAERYFAATGPFTSVASVTSVASGTQTNNSSVSYTVTSLRAAGYTDRFYFRARAEIQGPGGTYNPPTLDTDFIELPGLAQSVTLAPDSGNGSLLTGQTFVGTATGAQAGNAYNISIVSGDASASINPSTGDYTVTAGSTSGPVSYKVWVSAGGGYSRSPDVSGSIGVALSKKVKVTIPANNGAYAITYKLYQDGEEIGSVTRLAGASAIITVIDVGASGGSVTMKSFTSGLMMDDVIIVDDAAGTVEADIPIVITPTADPSAPPIAIPPPSTSSPLAQTPLNSQPALVWSSEGGSSGDALTNGVFREGVGKIVGGLGGDPNLTIPDDTPQIEANVADTDAKVGTVLSSLGDVADKTDEVVGDVTSKKPVFTAVTGSQYVYVLPMPMLPQPITIDLSFIETPIQLMRTVIKVAFLLFMWFLYAKTLKSASV